MNCFYFKASFWKISVDSSIFTIVRILLFINEAKCVWDDLCCSQSDHLRHRVLFDQCKPSSFYNSWEKSKMPLKCLEVKTASITFLSAVMWMKNDSVNHMWLCSISAFLLLLGFLWTGGSCCTWGRLAGLQLSSGRWRSLCLHSGCSSANHLLQRCSNQTAENPAGEGTERTAWMWRLLRPALQFYCSIAAI